MTNKSIATRHPPVGLKPTDAVVKQASDFGAPKGVDPHAVKNKLVTIDPGTEHEATVKVSELGRLFGKEDKVVTAPVEDEEAKEIIVDDPGIVRDAPGPPSGLLEKFKETLNKSKPVVYNENSENSTPTHEVLFEIKHFGNQTAFYHDVILTDDYIVLAYNNAFMYKCKYFPSSTIKEPFACTCKGISKIFLIKPTNVLFDYHNMSFCVLEILQVVDL